MRKRLLDPGFFLNEDLVDCDPMARLLFAGLTLYCDREGKFEWRPKRIKGAIFPHDPCDMDNLLSQLRTPALIVQYNVNGNEYGIIPKFLRHQNPHKNEKKSTLPDPLPEITRNSTESPEITLLSVPVPIPIPIPIKKTSCSNSDAIEAATLLKDLLVKEKPNFKEPTPALLNTWSLEIDRMIRIDNRDPTEIIKFINWLFTDNLDNEVQFVVQSAKSLRKKYDRIETQIAKGDRYL